MTDMFVAKISHGNHAQRAGIHNPTRYLPSSLLHARRILPHLPPPCRLAVKPHVRALTAVL